MRIKDLTMIFTVIYMSMIFVPVFYMNVNINQYIGFNIVNKVNVLIVIHGLILMYNPSVYLSKPMLYVYTYYALFWLLSLTGFYDTSNQWFWHYQYPTHIATLIYANYMSTKDYKAFALVILSALIFIAVTAVVNIVMIYRYPEAARSMFDATYGSDALIAHIRNYTRLGLASYDFVSGIPFLIPVLIGVYKFSKRMIWKYLSFIAISIILVSTFFSAFTAPLLIAVVGLIVGYLGKRKIKSSAVMVLVFIMIFILIPRSIVADMFYYASSSVENRDLSKKLHDIGLSLVEGVDVSSPTNSVESRAQRIPMLFGKFLSSPIWGTGYSWEAHIFWLNYLGMVGILGTMPLLLILFSNIRITIAKISEQHKFYYITSVVLFILNGFIKGSSEGLMYYILIIIPGVNYLVYLNSLPEISKTG